MKILDAKYKYLLTIPNKISIYIWVYLRCYIQDHSNRNDRFNPNQSSNDQSPWTAKASTGNENVVGKNSLGTVENSKSSVFWDQEAGRFVSASTRNIGSSQVSGTELLYTGQSIFYGRPLVNEQVNGGPKNSGSMTVAVPKRGSTSSYY